MKMLSDSKDNNIRCTLSLKRLLQYKHENNVNRFHIFIIILTLKQQITNCMHMQMMAKQNLPFLNKLQMFLWKILFRKASTTFLHFWSNSNILTSKQHKHLHISLNNIKWTVAWIRTDMQMTKAQIKNYQQSKILLST